MLDRQLGPLLPRVGDGLPADRGDELDGELLLLRVDVAVVYRRADTGDRFKPKTPAATDYAGTRVTSAAVLPLSMVSNSFSSPVIRGMRVVGSLMLVHMAYTWGASTQQAGQSTQRCVGNRSHTCVFIFLSNTLKQ